MSKFTMSKSMLAMLPLGLLAVLASGPSHAQSGGHQSLSEADQKFLSYAAEDNQAEIQLCLIAEKRALDPALKAFARLMVNDHVGVESRLSALSNELQANLPDGIGHDGEQTMSKLAPLKGEQFEHQFMQAQIKDHSEDIEKFSKQQDSTQNERIRQFASETVPILKQHLAIARAVQATLRSGPAGGDTTGQSSRPQSGRQ